MLGLTYSHFMYRKICRLCKHVHFDDIHHALDFYFSQYEMLYHVIKERTNVFSKVYDV